MSELEEIVKGFKEYRRIVVTGPQRSGTKIASRMIADILGWKFVNERELFGTETDHDDAYFKWDMEHAVLQCPSISHVCQKTPKEALVVFMMRDVNDILASDTHRKNKFTRFSSRQNKYINAISVFTDKKNQYSRYFYDGKPITVNETPQAVYDAWNTTQKKADFNWYELDYTLLEQHRFWLPLHVRRTLFTSGTQTTI